MMNKISALLVSMILSVCVFAQTGDNLKVFLKPVSETGEALETRDKSVLMSDETHQMVVLALTYNSSESPVKFHIKLGNTEGGKEKAEMTINADGSNLPEGVEIVKKDNVYYLTIGNFNGMSSFYAEVKVETANGVGPSIEYFK